MQNFVGRLHQVEYAMEAIGQAGTCLGILANDGVLIEKRVTNELLDNKVMQEKIYRLNEFVCLEKLLNLMRRFIKNVFSWAKWPAR